MDGAGPALREPAAEMRVAEAELVTQHVKQRRIRGYLDDSCLPATLLVPLLRNVAPSKASPADAH
jgi:hypothetical protein